VQDDNGKGFAFVALTSAAGVCGALHSTQSASVCGKVIAFGESGRRLVIPCGPIAEQRPDSDVLRKGRRRERF